MVRPRSTLKFLQRWWPGMFFLIKLVMVIPKLLQKCVYFTKWGLDPKPHRTGENTEGHSGQCDLAFLGCVTCVGRCTRCSGAFIMFPISQRKTLLRARSRHLAKSPGQNSALSLYRGHFGLETGYSEPPCHTHAHLPDRARPAFQLERPLSRSSHPVSECLPPTGRR